MQFNFHVLHLLPVRFHTMRFVLQQQIYDKASTKLILKTGRPMISYGFGKCMFEFLNYNM